MNPRVVAKEPLTVIVSAKRGEPVTRRYLNPTRFKHWRQFLEICSNDSHLEEIEAAWNKILPRGFGYPFSGITLKEILNGKCVEADLKTSLQVDWHLNYIVHEYLKKLRGSNKSLFVKTNAFRDYHATEIHSAQRKLCCPPFFETLKFGAEGKDAKANLEKMKRGFQDTHLFLALPISKIFSETKNKDERQELLAELFSWFEVKLKIQVASKNSNSLRLEIDLQKWDDGLKWSKVSRSNIQHKTWSFPGFLDGILLSSPQVRRCVERLSVAWRNVDMHKLLLLAPPGSGKEVLISLFQAARMIGKNWKKEIISAELKDQANLDRRLRELVPYLKQPSSRRKRVPSRSWQRPILVVDEIHQATRAERASMLRFLENNKIRVRWRRSELDIKQLIWLFVASESRADLLTKRAPPDFWTRMDQIIELNHPLDFLDAEERVGDTRRRVLADYFWMFWRGNDKQKEKEIDNERDSVRKNILKMLLDDEAFGLANKFAESVGSPLVGLFSVRYIRGMAKRIKGEAILYGLQSGPLESEFLEKANEKMNKWTTVAFMDMVMTKKVDNV